jgi:hypothetical protein
MHGLSCIHICRRPPSSGVFRHEHVRIRLDGGGITVVCRRLSIHTYLKYLSFVVYKHCMIPSAQNLYKIVYA